MLKMKSLGESLLDNGLIDKTDKMIKDEIEAFLKENYDGLIKISRKSNIPSLIRLSVFSTKSSSNKLSLNDFIFNILFHL